MARPALLLLLLGVCFSSSSALFSDKDNVLELTADNWDEEVRKSSDFIIVEFYAPWCGHCKQLAPEWIKAAKELNGIARVAAVDCDEHKDIASKYGVKGFPTIKVFKEGGTSEPVDYTDARTADGVVSFVKGALGGAGASSKMVPNIKYLDAYAFMYMLEPKVTTKVILFTKGEKKVPGWFSSLAVKYKKGKDKTAAFSMVMMEVDDQALLAARLGVKEPGVVVARVTGQGDAWYTTITSLEEKGSDNLKKAQAVIDEVVAETYEETKQVPMPSLPPPDKPRKQADTAFFQLDEDTLPTKCLGNSKKSICLIAVVAAGGDEFIERDTLIDLSKKYRNDPLSFTFVDGRSQTEFISGFGVTWDGSPKVIAIKTGRKNRFAVMDVEASFSQSTISSFVDKILGGDMMFKPLKQVPEIVPAYLMDMKEEL